MSLFTEHGGGDEEDVDEELVDVDHVATRCWVRLCRESARPLFIPGRQHTITAVFWLAIARTGCCRYCELMCDTAGCYRTTRRSDWRRSRAATPRAAAHCLPNTPACAALRSTPEYKLPISVPQTNRSQRWYHRNIVIIIGSHTLVHYFFVVRASLVHFWNIVDTMPKLNVNINI